MPTFNVLSDETTYVSFAVRGRAVFRSIRIEVRSSRSASVGVVAKLVNVEAVKTCDGSWENLLVTSHYGTFFKTIRKQNWLIGSCFKLHGATC